MDLAGIELKHPIMNGAGTCKTVEDVEKFSKSNIPAIMLGPITVPLCEGNPGEVFWRGDLFSLNAVGLANPGETYYQKNFPRMVEIARNSGKYLFVNVAGLNLLEYVSLTELAFRGGAALVELNISCPNIWKNSHQEIMPCFYPQLVAKILQSVGEKVGQKARIAVKLSPFSNPFLLREVAQVISKFRVVKVVTTSNTFPNALAFDGKGKSRISSNNGLSGLGGPALKPIALGQVRQLRDILPKRIDIIGCGGIAKGIDVLDFIDPERAGATAVQVATAILDKEPRRVFDRLLLEFVEALKKHKECSNW